LFNQINFSTTHQLDHPYILILGVSKSSEDSKQDYSTEHIHGVTSAAQMASGGLETNEQDRSVSPLPKDYVPRTNSPVSITGVPSDVSPHSQASPHCNNVSGRNDTDPSTKTPQNGNKEPNCDAELYDAIEYRELEGGSGLPDFWGSVLPGYSGTHKPAETITRAMQPVNEDNNKCCCMVM
jgi:hypothetical protein